MNTEIDAHQHFWQLSQPFRYEWLDAPALAPIKRDFLPEHLAALIQPTPIKRTIFVQTQHDLAENRWALGLAEHNSFIAGVVGWVDLASPACVEQVLEFKAHPRFVGVRHITQDEPDDDFIVSQPVLNGLRVLERYGVPFDLLFYVKHLRHAATLARQFPALPMVIDHLAKPCIKDRRMDDWKPHFKAAAAYPNVYCKLSGMITEADWRHWRAEDLKPYVQTALELFGPERCMFGSDWPVCELAGTYAQVYQSLVDALGPISSADHHQIFGGTAARFYRL